MSWINRLAALLLLSMVGVGCSNVQRPTATLKAANLGELTSDGFLVNFDVDVANPNAFDLPIGAADYALSFGGVKVVDDKATLEGAIPASGSKAVRIPVRLTFDDLMKAEKVIRAGGGDIPYEFDGALGFGGAKSLASLGVPTKVPLNYSGTLPLRQYLSDPAVLLKNPAARKLLGKGIGSLLGQ